MDAAWSEWYGRHSYRYRVLYLAGYPGISPNKVNSKRTKKSWGRSSTKMRSAKRIWNFPPPSDAFFFCMSAAILAGINVHTSSRVQDGDDRRKKSDRPTTGRWPDRSWSLRTLSPGLVTFLLFCLSSPSSTHIKPRIRPPLSQSPSPFRIGKTIWLAREGVVPLWLFRPNCCGVTSSDSPSFFSRRPPLHPFRGVILVTV